MVLSLRLSHDYFLDPPPLAHAETWTSVIAVIIGTTVMRLTLGTLVKIKPKISKKTHIKSSRNIKGSYEAKRIHIVRRLRVGEGENKI